MSNSNVLHFPDRSLLKLIDAVDGVLDGSCEPTKALSLAEAVMLEMGGVQDADGKWHLPAGDE